jgi:hypothetical protein
MKKDVAVALHPHPGLKTIEIWRGKPAAASRRTTFSSASWERARYHEALPAASDERSNMAGTRGVAPA